METEIVFGVHPVREVLSAGKRTAHELVVGRSSKDPAAKDILKLARQKKIPYRIAGRQDVEKMAPGGNHQGFALVADALEERELEAFLSTADTGRKAIWIGLDGVTDPHNLGAVIRNAACFGATAVVLPQRDSARLSPLVQKIASGATEYMPVVQAPSINHSIRRLREDGFFVFAAALEGIPLPDLVFEGPAYVLIGAEGRGLKRKTREMADERVAIPQAPGGVASLNASAAAAVMLYEVRRCLG
ncbi:MAG: 23S rRNA (guanosine(2251)-2'-O)-methyltransferase RlmB [Planctomycetota bacterium]